jgi:polar amino acid transport system substrate-binding protein
MNKIIPIVALSLLASIFAIWFLAHRAPTAHTSAHDDILIVGTNSEYAPYSFMQDNTVVGFDIDLINEVAKRMNKKIELRDMAFDALIPALQIGSIQVIGAGLTPTPDRALRIYFTKPYIHGDPLLIISPASNPLTTLDQLKGKKVAVNEGFTADYYMAKVEGPELVRYAAPIESFMALENKSVDAFVAARSSIKSFIDHYGKEKFSLAEIPTTGDEYAIAISKKYPELLEPIQKALDEIAADGTLEMLKKKWLE